MTQKEANQETLGSIGKALQREDLIGFIALALLEGGDKGPGYEVFTSTPACGCQTCTAAQRLLGAMVQAGSEMMERAESGVITARRGHEVSH